MKTTLVSVIIPCYNSGNYISKTLSSILSQSYSNLEVIIVNDGSTDDSEEKILNCKDPRIKYYSRENGGQCSASNYGAQKSSGEYIKFFDADDIMNSIHIEEQLKRINGFDSALASCAWGRFYDEDPNSSIFKPESVWKDLLPIDWLKSSLSQNSNMMAAWLWLIPRKVWKKTGGWNEKLSLNNDFDFSVRLLHNASMVYFVPNAKVFYRTVKSGSLSNSSSEKAFQDLYNSTYMGCSLLLKSENSEIMKRICANRYQDWIYTIYPNYPKIINTMEQQVQLLGGSSIKMEGGLFFRIISSMFGWKNAKRFRIFLNKFGYKKLPFN